MADKRVILFMNKKDSKAEIMKKEIMNEILASLILFM